MALAAMKEELTAQYDQLLRSRLEEMDTLMRNEVKQQELHFEEALQAKLLEASESRKGALERLNAQVKSLEDSIAFTRAADEASTGVHKVTAAALSLANKFETDESFKKEAALMQSLAEQRGDAHLGALLSRLPQKSGGVATLPQLQYRFQRVKAAARHEANVPEGMGGFGGQLVAYAVTALSVEPKGMVKGGGAEECLARAAFHVDNGDLGEAAKEVDGLGGRAKGAVADWLAEAKARVLVDELSAAVRLYAAELNRQQLSS